MLIAEVAGLRTSLPENVARPTEHYALSVEQVVGVTPEFAQFATALA